MRKLFLSLAAILFLGCFSSAVNSEGTSNISSAAAIPQSTAGAVIPAQEKPEAAPVAQATQGVPAPAPAEIPQEKPKESNEIVIIDDSLPESSITEGTWSWDTSIKYSGEKSHTEPPTKALTEHSFRMKGIDIPKNSVIEQYVYLDPVNIPKGILIKFRFEKDGKEGEIGIYREGEEEVFVFNNDEPMLYDGILPNAGKWEKLVAYSEDLGLSGAKLTGMSFETYGGKAYWDLTLIRPIKEGEQYPQAEQFP